MPDAVTGVRVRSEEQRQLAYQCRSFEDSAYFVESALSTRLTDRHAVRLAAETDDRPHHNGLSTATDDRPHHYDATTRTLHLSSRLRPGQRAFRMVPNSPCSNTEKNSTARRPRTLRPPQPPTPWSASASPTTSPPR